MIRWRELDAFVSEWGPIPVSYETPMKFHEPSKVRNVVLSDIYILK